MLSDYPIIFTLTNEIRLGAQLVRVVSSGSILMTIEDGAWWCHGVQPGGLTEQGSEPAEAFAAFKYAYAQILRDLAAESGDLEGFEAGVEQFVMDRDAAEAARWNAARAEIRTGKHLEEPFEKLRRISGEFTASVSVEPVRFEAGEDVVALAEAA